MYEHNIFYLFEDVRNREVFVTMRYDRRVQLIAKEIVRGNYGLQRILEASTIQESAAALQFFLVNLKKPLIPHDIQSLALGNLSINFNVRQLLFLLYFQKITQMCLLRR